MSRRKMGVRVVITSGAGVVGLLVVAAVSWENLLVGYHADRIRREPRYLLEIIQKPEGTVQRKAVRSFVANADRRLRPFWVYMAEIAIDHEASPAVRSAALDALDEWLGGGLEVERRDANRGATSRFTSGTVSRRARASAVEGSASR